VLSPTVWSTRADLPINGNGILEQTNTGTTAPVDINNEGCLDDPLYISLGCNCWYTGTASCPATLPDFCKSCTKVRWCASSACHVCRHLI
jgi:hypothetical protein